MYYIVLYFRCMRKPHYWISFFDPMVSWVGDCGMYCTHYTSTLSYCLLSSCLEGEIGWGEMYGVGVSVHGGKQVNGCMPSLNNKTWKCLTWIVKVFEFQQLHELCWRTSTWKWDWKNPFTIWGSDLSLCASRGGHYQFKMCYDFCFCCWFRRRVPS